MEGDAGSGQLNPTPPNTGDDAERSEAKEPVTVTRSDSSGDDAERSEAEEPAAEADADGGADPDAVEPDSAGAPSEVGEAVEGSGGGVFASYPWLSRVCAAVILVSVLIAVGGGFAVWGHMRNAAADRAATTALAAAKDCVAVTQAPDAKAMAASATKIIECSTGDFATQAKIYSGVLVDAYQAANAQVEVTNMRAAVERQNPDGTIDVLVAVRTKLSNSEQEPQEQGYRLRVRMALDDGTYKVARMDQVSQ